MPYNTRLRGKNPYSVNVDNTTKKTVETLSPSKNKKSPTSAASPAKKVKLSSPVKEGRDQTLVPVKKAVHNQICSLKGKKPSEIKPKANYSHLVKKNINKKTPKRISKKYITQKRNNILKNVDVKNLKHVKCAVNSEILNKNLCNTIKVLGPEQIKTVLKPKAKKCCGKQCASKK